MSSVRLIGDIHGSWRHYKQHILEGCESSVQVGDFGFGFNGPADQHMLDWQSKNPQHRFIRGNHDDIVACEQSLSYIKDGSVLLEHRAMCIGGAWSVDYAFRKEGQSWWPDEECSHEQFDNFSRTYLQDRPRVMITHEAPMQIPKWHKFIEGNIQTTRTGLRLGQMWHQYKPELWVFGHWHLSFDKTVEGTRFICLNIDQWIDLNWNTLEVTYS